MSQTSTQPPRKQETVSVAYAPPKRSWRRRLAYSLRSWSRVTFSRESYMASLRSLLWVVPLTALIWIYAEREQVTTLPNVTINVAPPAVPPGRLLARFAPGTIHTIHAELKGPQSSAEEAKEILESNTIALDLERDLSPGDHTIVIADVLNRDPRIIAKGAEVRNCVPAEVTVTVEKISEKLLDVKVRSDDAKGLPPLAFDPPKVKVTIPDSEYARAEADNRLYVYPNLKSRADELSQTGQHTLLNVAVAPAFEDPLNAVTVSPITVTAKYDRPSTEDTYVMPVMAVNGTYPYTEQPDKLALVAKYEPKVIPRVELIGPKEQLDAIRNGQVIQPHATFDVDLTGSTPTARLYYVALPPGVRVKDPNVTVTYTLEPRKQ